MSLLGDGLVWGQIRTPHLALHHSMLTYIHVDERTSRNDSRATPLSRTIGNHVNSRNSVGQSRRSSVCVVHDWVSTTFEPSKSSERVLSVKSVLHLLPLASHMTDVAMQVRLVQKVDTGKIYAMKSLKKSEMFKKDQVSLLANQLTGTDSF